MTLKELAAKVTGEKWNKTPKVTDLIASGSPVIASGEHNDGNITVFENGYILYTEDDHLTIFHISDIYGKDTVYHTLNDSIIPENTRRINADVFYDLDWKISAVMHGNWRVLHNCNVYQNNLVEYHYSGLPEDYVDRLCYTPDYLTDEPVEEDHFSKAIEAVKVRIVPTQWDVYIGIVVQDLTEEQLAVKLNISQQAVCKRYRKAIKNIEKNRKDVLLKIDKGEI